MSRRFTDDEIVEGFARGVRPLLEEPARAVVPIVRAITDTVFDDPLLERQRVVKLEILAGHPDVEVRNAVARKPDLPESVKAILEQTPHSISESSFDGPAL